MNVKSLSARAGIRIRCPRATVFAAFADAETMSRFWFNRRDHGLVEGESSTWFLGNDEDAYSFNVHVKQVCEPERIVIDWEGPDGHCTQVVWHFEEIEDGDTILTIEESGFSGDSGSIVEQVLDSTCGFNQAIVAAKALVEHGVALNVVADHA
ncbi:MAG: SRPBCC domain-containing protein [Proteobacteria bacterium]|nr:SRPBCC domain-containing protein [Pseudomonadota bacterium]